MVRNLGNTGEAVTEDRLTLMLRELLPRNMADDLDAEGGTEFIADMVRRYLEADEDSRADIRAFHESDGPAKVKDAHERLAPATG